ncbi:hypothetical protein [uncultured Clostridium sp.]|uniref:hypothetical protein n=1 Tax=uncultured Clostridium sp. TaxID=59620 RepID=UPI0028ECB224|nr:hypothetical protein [uncultured Clostridium sp.]
MLRKYLESKGITLTDSEFNTVMQMVTDDVKFNNIGFNRKTDVNDIVTIAEISARTLKRCDLDGSEIYDSNGQTVADIADIAEVESGILKDLLQESLDLIEDYKSIAKYWEGMYKSLDSRVRHIYKDF